MQFLNLHHQSADTASNIQAAAMPKR